MPQNANNLMRKPDWNRGKRTCTLAMNPVDAEKLGVSTGDMVTVCSAVGSVDIPVKVVNSTDILPGVVQVTHGWHESNINLITHDDRNDPIDGFPLMKSVEINIRPKKR